MKHVTIEPCQAYNYLTLYTVVHSKGDIVADRPLGFIERTTWKQFNENRFATHGFPTSLLNLGRLTIPLLSLDDFHAKKVFRITFIYDDGNDLVTGCWADVVANSQLSAISVLTSQDWWTGERTGWVRCSETELEPSDQEDRVEYAIGGKRRGGLYER